MVESIYSPLFGRSYLVADNYSVVKDAVCPIDKTPLVSVSEYDISQYECLACGIIYPFGEKSETNLKEIAKKRILQIQEDLKKKQKELNKEFSKLERILSVAKKTEDILR